MSDARPNIRVVRLHELTPAQRAVVMALLNAKGTAVSPAAAERVGASPVNLGARRSGSVVPGRAGAAGPR